MKCMVCEKPVSIAEPYVYYKNLIPAVCSLPCLVQFLKNEPTYSPPNLRKISLKGPSVFRSQLERQVYEELKPHFPDIQHEPYVFIVTTSIGSDIYYIPDLYIPSKNIYLEVKGFTSNRWKYHYLSDKIKLYIVPKEVVNNG